MEKTKILISEIIQMLEDGKTRTDIQEKYGLNASEIKTLFKHPKLKGRKTKKPLSFELIDDTQELEVKNDVQVENEIPELKAKIENEDTNINFI